VYGKKEAYLKNLYLQTPKTVLRDEVILNYNSVEQLSANPGAVKIAADIRNSKIGFADILNLVPTLKNTAPFNKYPNAVLNVNAQVEGLVNDLLIKDLKVSGLDQLRIAASGRIKNAMNPDQLYYDLRIGLTWFQKGQFLLIFLCHHISASKVLQREPRRLSIPISIFSPL